MRDKEKIEALTELATLYLGVPWEIVKKHLGESRWNRVCYLYGYVKLSLHVTETSEIRKEREG